MNRQKLLPQTASLAIVLFILLACSGLQAAPVQYTIIPSEPPSPEPTSAHVPPAALTGSPSIQSVGLRREMSPRGLIIYQDVRFTDSEGDVYRWDFEIVSATAQGMHAEGGELNISGAEQRSGAVATGEWTCGWADYSVTLNVTFTDRAGHHSLPYEYTMVCDADNSPTTAPVPPPSGTTPKPSSLPSASVEFKQAQRYRVEYTSTLYNRGFSFEKVLVYLPRPVEWDGQQDLHIEAVTPQPSEQGTDPTFGNGIYYWQLKGKPRPGESMQFKIQFNYTAYEISATVKPENVQPYDKSSPLYKLYTRPERFIESADPQIVEIANRVAGTETNPYELARKFYNHVVETANYRLVGKGLLGAKALITNGEGECGDFSAYFIALARAKGIPARPVVGYWAITGIGQAHVWAEFYLEGIGWIPVDPTIGQQSARNKNYYFGNMDNQRVILHKGFNVPLVPQAPDNCQAELMQGPFFWFWGEGDGEAVSMDVTGWKVTPIP